MSQSESSSTSTVLSPVRNGLNRCLDTYIDFLLVRGEGERIMPPEKRISFSEDIRQRIYVHQNGKCMYCGSYLRKGWHVDHIYPREHGGSNDESNLQGLCPTCNTRKGVMTDREFRQRYRRILPKLNPKMGPVPPDERIASWKFDDITQSTAMASSTRSRRNSKYSSPRKKICSGSLMTGLVAAVIFVMGISILLELRSPASITFMTALGVILWAGLSSSLIIRAKVTGKLVNKDSELPRAIPAPGDS